MKTIRVDFLPFSRAVMSASCLAALLTAGCQTNPTEDGATASRSQGSSGQEPVERQQMQVSVSGAGASQSGDTLTLDYPVLRDVNDRIPDWVVNPGLGGVIGAVGVAAPKGLGTREQLEEARLSARLEVASMLETRLQAVGRGELQEDMRATQNGTTEQSRKNILGVDRDILDVVLAGSRQRALWFDPETKECFVWIVLDGKILEGVKHEVVDTVSTFVATATIASEYRPQRAAPQVPQVVVESVTPQPTAEPQAPQTPIQELEGNLKPIKTISIRKEGEGGGGGGVER